MCSVPALPPPLIQLQISPQMHNSVPSAACDISLLMEVALELVLFHISWTLCVGYISVCFPDKALHVCVLGFLAKGHSDWCFPCSLRADQEAACSLLWSVTAVSLQAQWDQTSQCDVQYHVSGLLSPLILLWIVPFLFEGSRCVLSTVCS